MDFILVHESIRRYVPWPFVRGTSTLVILVVPLFLLNEQFLVAFASKRQRKSAPAIALLRNNSDVRYINRRKNRRVDESSLSFDDFRYEIGLLVFII